MYAGVLPVVGCSPAALFSMQPILIGRFIINLHDANDSLSNNEASSPSKMESDVYFRIPSVVDTVVGNMGQTLRVGGEPHGALDVEDEIEKFDDLQIATRSEDAVDALTVLDWDDGGLHEVRCYSCSHGAC